MAAVAAIRERFERFAEAECRGYSDAYYALALAVAGDTRTLAFLAGVPVAQPNLFLAALQLLTGPDRMPRTAAELRGLLDAREEEIAAVMRARRTQTNEVGRCAALLPALPPGPLALVEVGASAGLCLLVDRYSYAFGETHIGPATSPVHLRCAVTGPAPVPRALPEIVWRHGLDREPLDARDDEAARWLLACVWADHPERRRRLEGALALARAHPPRVRTGDLVDDLPGVLAEAPADAQLVLFHSAVLGYVTPERRAAFAEALARASARRDVVWISNEAPGLVPEIAALAPAPAPGRFLLGRTWLAAGRRRDELLGVAHPHGAELAWRGP